MGSGKGKLRNKGIEKLIKGQDKKLNEKLKSIKGLLEAKDKERAWRLYKVTQQLCPEEIDMDISDGEDDMIPSDEKIREEINTKVQCVSSQVPLKETDDDISKALKNLICLSKLLKNDVKEMNNDENSPPVVSVSEVEPCMYCNLSDHQTQNCTFSKSKKSDENTRKEKITTEKLKRKNRCLHCQLTDHESEKCPFLKNQKEIKKSTISKNILPSIYNPQRTHAETKLSQETSTSSVSQQNNLNTSNSQGLTFTSQCQNNVTDNSQGSPVKHNSTSSTSTHSKSNSVTKSTTELDISLGKNVKVKTSKNINLNLIQVPIQKETELIKNIYVIPQSMSHSNKTQKSPINVTVGGISKEIPKDTTEIQTRKEVCSKRADHSKTVNVNDSNIILSKKTSEETIESHNVNLVQQKSKDGKYESKENLSQYAKKQENEAISLSLKYSTDDKVKCIPKSEDKLNVEKPLTFKHVHSNSIQEKSQGNNYESPKTRPKETRLESLELKHIGNNEVNTSTNSEKSSEIQQILNSDNANFIQEKCDNKLVSPKTQAKDVETKLLKSKYIGDKEDNILPSSEKSSEKSKTVQSSNSLKIKLQENDLASKNRTERKFQDSGCSVNKKKENNSTNPDKSPENKIPSSVAMEQKIQSSPEKSKNKISTNSEISTETENSKENKITTSQEKSTEKEISTNSGKSTENNIPTSQEKSTESKIPSSQEISTENKTETSSDESTEVEISKSKHSRDIEIKITPTLTLPLNENVNTDTIIKLSQGFQSSKCERRVSTEDFLCLWKTMIHEHAQVNTCFPDTTFIINKNRNSSSALEPTCIDTTGCNTNFVNEHENRTCDANVPQNYNQESREQSVTFPTFTDDYQPSTEPDEAYLSKEFSHPLGTSVSSHQSDKKLHNNESQKSPSSLMTARMNSSNETYSKKYSSKIQSSKRNGSKRTTIKEQRNLPIDTITSNAEDFKSQNSNILADKKKTQEERQGKLQTKCTNSSNENQKTEKKSESENKSKSCNKNPLLSAAMADKTNIKANISESSLQKTPKKINEKVESPIKSLKATMEEQVGQRKSSQIVESKRKKETTLKINSENEKSKKSKETFKKEKTVSTSNNNMHDSRTPQKNLKKREKSRNEQSPKKDPTNKYALKDLQDIQNFWKMKFSQKIVCAQESTKNAGDTSLDQEESLPQLKRRERHHKPKLDDSSSASTNNSLKNQDEELTKTKSKETSSTEESKETLLDSENSKDFSKQKEKKNSDKGKLKPATDLKSTPAKTTDKLSYLCKSDIETRTNEKHSKYQKLSDKGKEKVEFHAVLKKPKGGKDINTSVSKYVIFEDKVSQPADKPMEANLMIKSATHVEKRQKSHKERKISGSTQHNKNKSEDRENSVSHRNPTLEGKEIFPQSIKSTHAINVSKSNDTDNSDNQVKTNKKHSICKELSHEQNMTVESHNEVIKTNACEDRNNSVLKNFAFKEKAYNKHGCSPSAGEEKHTSEINDGIKKRNSAENSSGENMVITSPTEAEKRQKTHKQRKMSGNTHNKQSVTSQQNKTGERETSVQHRKAGFEEKEIYDPQRSRKTFEKPREKVSANNKARDEKTESQLQENVQCENQIKRSLSETDSRLKNQKERKMSGNTNKKNVICHQTDVTDVCRKESMNEIRTKSKSESIMSCRLKDKSASRSSKTKQEQGTKPKENCDGLIVKKQQESNKSTTILKTKENLKEKHVRHCEKAVEIERPIQKTSKVTEKEANIVEEISKQKSVKNDRQRKKSGCSMKEKKENENKNEKVTDSENHTDCLKQRSITSDKIQYPVPEHTDKDLHFEFDNPPKATQTHNDENQEKSKQCIHTSETKQPRNEETDRNIWEDLQFELNVQLNSNTQNICELNDKHNQNGLKLNSEHQLMNNEVNLKDNTTNPNNKETQITKTDTKIKEIKTVKSNKITEHHDASDTYMNKYKPHDIGNSIKIIKTEPYDDSFSQEICRNHNVQAELTFNVNIKSEPLPDTIDTNETTSADHLQKPSDKSDKITLEEDKNYDAKSIILPDCTVSPETSNPRILKESSPSLLHKHIQSPKNEKILKQNQPAENYQCISDQSLASATQNAVLHTQIKNKEAFLTSVMRTPKEKLNSEGNQNFELLECELQRNEKCSNSDLQIVPTQGVSVKTEPLSSTTNVNVLISDNKTTEKESCLIKMSKDLSLNINKKKKETSQQYLPCDVIIKQESPNSDAAEDKIDGNDNSLITTTTESTKSHKENSQTLIQNITLKDSVNIVTNSSSSFTPISIKQEPTDDTKSTSTDMMARCEQEINTSSKNIKDPFLISIKLEPLSPNEIRRITSQITENPSTVSKISPSLIYTNDNLNNVENKYIKIEPKSPEPVTIEINSDDDSEEKSNKAIKTGPKSLEPIHIELHCNDDNKERNDKTIKMEPKSPEFTAVERNSNEDSKTNSKYNKMQQKSPEPSTTGMKHGDQSTEGNKKGAIPKLQNSDTSFQTNSMRDVSTKRKCSEEIVGSQVCKKKLKITNDIAQPQHSEYNQANSKETCLKNKLLHCQRTVTECSSYMHNIKSPSTNKNIVKDNEKMPPMNQLTGKACDKTPTNMEEVDEKTKKAGKLSSIIRIPDPPKSSTRSRYKRESSVCRQPPSRVTETPSRSLQLVKRSKQILSRASVQRDIIKPKASFSSSLNHKRDSRERTLYRNSREKMSQRMRLTSKFSVNNENKKISAISNYIKDNENDKVSYDDIDSDDSFNTEYEKKSSSDTDKIEYDDIDSDDSLFYRNFRNEENQVIKRSLNVYKNLRKQRNTKHDEYNNKSIRDEEVSREIKSKLQEIKDSTITSKMCDDRKMNYISSTCTGKQERQNRNEGNDKLGTRKHESHVRDEGTRKQRERSLEDKSDRKESFLSYRFEKDEKDQCYNKRNDGSRERDFHDRREYDRHRNDYYDMMKTPRDDSYTNRLRDYNGYYIYDSPRDRYYRKEDSYHRDSDVYSHFSNFYRHGDLRDSYNDSGISYRYIESKDNRPSSLHSGESRTLSDICDHFIKENEDCLFNARQKAAETQGKRESRQSSRETRSTSSSSISPSKHYTRCISPRHSKSERKEYDSSKKYRKRSRSPLSSSQRSRRRESSRKNRSTSPSSSSSFDSPDRRKFTRLENSKRERIKCLSSNHSKENKAKTSVSRKRYSTHTETKNLPQSYKSQSSSMKKTTLTNKKKTVSSVNKKRQDIPVTCDKSTKQNKLSLPVNERNEMKSKLNSNPTNKTHMGSKTSAVKSEDGPTNSENTLIKYKTDKPTTGSQSASKSGAAQSADKLTKEGETSKTPSKEQTITLKERTLTEDQSASTLNVLESDVVDSKGNGTTTHQISPKDQQTFETLTVTISNSNSSKMKNSTSRVQVVQHSNLKLLTPVTISEEDLRHKISCKPDEKKAGYSADMHEKNKPETSDQQRKEIKQEIKNLPSPTPLIDMKEVLSVGSMARVFISDGQEVCLTFNLTKYTGVDCNKDCKLLHLTLPIYDPNALESPVTKLESTNVQNVITDSEGRICFFLKSGKMICNMFNSKDKCNNKHCFMRHLSLYQALNIARVKSKVTELKNRLKQVQTTEKVKQQSQFKTCTKEKNEKGCDQTPTAQKVPQKSKDNPRNQSSQNKMECELFNSSSGCKKVQCPYAHIKKQHSSIEGEKNAARQQDHALPSVQKAKEEKMNIAKEYKPDQKLVEENSPNKNICKFFNSFSGCQNPRCPYAHIRKPHSLSENQNNIMKQEDNKSSTASIQIKKTENNNITKNNEQSPSSKQQSHKTSDDPKSLGKNSNNKPRCKFFNTIYGCRNATKCRFAHIQWPQRLNEKDNLQQKASSQKTHAANSITKQSSNTAKTENDEEKHESPAKKLKTVKDEQSTLNKKELSLRNQQNTISQGDKIPNTPTNEKDVKRSITEEKEQSIKSQDNEIKKDQSLPQKPSTHKNVESSTKEVLSAESQQDTNKEDKNQTEKNESEKDMQRRLNEKTESVKDQQNETENEKSSTEKDVQSKSKEESVKSRQNTIKEEKEQQSEKEMSEKLGNQSVPQKRKCDTENETNPTAKKACLLNKDEKTKPRRLVPLRKLLRTDVNYTCGRILYPNYATRGGFRPGIMGRSPLDVSLPQESYYNYQRRMYPDDCEIRPMVCMDFNSSRGCPLPEWSCQFLHQPLPSESSYPSRRPRHPDMRPHWGPLV